MSCESIFLRAKEIIETTQFTFDDQTYTVPILLYWVLYLYNEM